jgi:hypothetical protein
VFQFHEGQVDDVAADHDDADGGRRSNVAREPNGP